LPELHDTSGAPLCINRKDMGMYILHTEYDVWNMEINTSGRPSEHRKRPHVGESSEVACGGRTPISGVDETPLPRLQ
jgi:hypothetical protein